MKISWFSNIDISSIAFRETVNTIIIQLLGRGTIAVVQLRESSRFCPSSCVSLFTRKLRHYCMCARLNRSHLADPYVGEIDMYVCLSSRRWTTLQTHVEGKSSSTQARPYIFFFSFCLLVVIFSFFILPRSPSLFSVYILHSIRRIPRDAVTLMVVSRVYFCLFNSDKKNIYIFFTKNSLSWI